MNRRHFLALTLALTGAGLVFEGCGGVSGGGIQSAALRPLDGRVQLPTGLTLTGTKVVSISGGATPTNEGAFEIRIPENSPQPAQLLDANNKLLLLGLLQAGHSTLSVRSTAEFLVYHHLGLFLHTPPLRRQALALLRIEDLASVESAINSEIAAKGVDWLASPPSAVIAASKAAASAIKSRGRSRGMIISPTDRVSGIQITGDGIGSCTATNSFRRRGLLYHTPVSAKLDVGNEFPLPTNLTKVELNPIDGLSSPLGALADLFFAGKSYYTPVEIPFSTPRAPADAAYTKYKVYAVGLGIEKGTFDELPQPIQQEGKLLMVKSAVADFLYPLLASVIIPGFGEQIDEFVGYIIASDVLKDIVNAIAESFEVVDLLLAGKPAEAGAAIVKFIRLNTDSFQVLVLGLIAAFVQRQTGGIFDPQTGQKLDVLQYTVDTWKKIDDALDLGEMAFVAFDSGIQLLDVASSRLGESWEIAVTKAKVSLSPQEIIVAKNALFSGIKANLVGIEAVEGKVFGYSWKCSSGNLSDGSQYGPVIESTSQDSVGYDAAGVSLGATSLTVEVFLRGGGETEPIGSASAPVYVTELTVSPTAKNLKANESVTLTPELKGMRPLKPGEKLTYKWLTTRNVGELEGSPDGGTTIPVETATATYRAHATKQGLDTVTVEAFLGSTKVGSAKSKINVGKSTVVVYGRTFRERWSTETTCLDIMTWSFPKVEGAKSYSVRVLNIAGGPLSPERTWSASVSDKGVFSDAYWNDTGGEIRYGRKGLYEGALGGGAGGKGSDGCGDGSNDTRFASWYQGATVEVTATL